jgi:hypothetical protein
MNLEIYKASMEFNKIFIVYQERTDDFKVKFAGAWSDLETLNMDMTRSYGKDWAINWQIKPVQLHEMFDDFGLR